jgi:ketosteroid isomerase-like protein
MRTFVGLAALALLSSGQAMAQEGPDAAAVCAMAERHYAAIRAGDMNAVLQQHQPEFTFFTSDGGLLWTFRSLDQQRTEFQERSPNFSSSTRIHHCSAQVYGNTGIATYYLVGSVTIGTSTTSGTWRVTEVWVRQGNEWKEAHHHESPLLDSVSPGRDSP